MAINDALEHVTLRNASAAICRHIYYLGDTSIRSLIIILITAARKLLRMCGCSHDSLLLISTVYTFDIGTLGGDKTDRFVRSFIRTASVSSSSEVLFSWIRSINYLDRDQDQ